MSHSVSFDKEDRIIKIVLREKINLLSLLDVASEVARISTEHDCHLILNDARDSTVELSVMQIYELPNVFMEILSEKGVQFEKFRRALVVSSDVEKFSFFETVSVNRGQSVRLFHDLEEGKGWLLQREP